MEPEWLKKIIYNDNSLLDFDAKLIRENIEIIKDCIREKKEQISIEQEKILKLGMLININELRNKGFSKEEIETFYIQDLSIIDNAKKYLEKQQLYDKNYVFGYPVNLSEESAVVEYLRWTEGQLSYMNSCGTPYEKGNYRMCLQDNELEVISKFINNLQLPINEYWGYITTGGTEGNLWGIREGFSHFPNGKLYFSKATHYSAIKGVNIISNNNYEVIDANDGKIDCEKLLDTIEKNYNQKNNEAIILLNYGTTELGSIDDIKYIKEKLVERNIPHYIHVDAALYGGIPNNQKYSPGEKNYIISDLKIDSISISLHKYLGVPKTNGVLLSKSQSNNKFIEYIGQSDVTLCGSRDYLPFTTVQKVREVFDRNSSFDYINNINYLENQLKKHNISYFKGEDCGNIFIIDKPSNEICEKYQLSTFKYNCDEKAHIIIFPGHKIEIIDELIGDIKQSYQLKKK